MSRTIFYFETDHVKKDALFQEGWAQTMASNAFQLAGLPPVAMVRGVVPLTPEYSVINFGSAEKPDRREVGRILLEMPDVASDDLIVVFAGAGLASLTEADPENYTEEQQRYWDTITGLYLNTKYIFGAEFQYEGCQVMTWEKVPGQVASKEFMVVDHIKGVVIEKPQQKIVANPELVKAAQERGLPLPENLGEDELNAILQADQEAAEQLAAQSVEDSLTLGTHTAKE